MNTNQIDSFQDVLATVMKRSIRAWVYLPIDRKWSLDSESATLESEEVPPELEDERWCTSVRKAARFNAGCSGSNIARYCIKCSSAKI